MSTFANINMLLSVPSFPSLFCTLPVKSARFFLYIHLFIFVMQCRYNRQRLRHLSSSFKNKFEVAHAWKSTSDNTICFLYQVGTSYDAGDYDGALRNSNIAKWLNLISFLCGIIIVIAVIVVFISTGN